MQHVIRKHFFKTLAIYTWVSLQFFLYIDLYLTLGFLRKTIVGARNRETSILGFFLYILICIWSLNILILNLPKSFLITLCIISIEVNLDNINLSDNYLKIEQWRDTRRLWIFWVHIFVKVSYHNRQRFLTILFYNFPFYIEKRYYLIAHEVLNLIATKVTFLGEK